MKLFYLLLIVFLTAVSGCASKSATKQDRNEILIDDLYKINKSLNQRVDDLEAHIKLLRNSLTKSPRASNKETSFKVKGKSHQINEEIYYGRKSKPAYNKNAPLPSKKPRKKKYSELARELDTKINAENNPKIQSKVMVPPQKTAKKNPEIELNSTIENANTPEKKTTNLNFQPIETFPAGTYRTTQAVKLVNEENQPQITWKAGTSFTAKETYGDYYKISGFFVDKQWTKATEILLIPMTQASKR